jgi:hypothetical protein
VPGFLVPFLVCPFLLPKIGGLKSLVYLYAGNGSKTWAAFTPLVICLFGIMQGNGLREE